MIILVPHKHYKVSFPVSSNNWLGHFRANSLIAHDVDDVNHCSNSLDKFTEEKRRAQYRSVSIK